MYVYVNKNNTKIGIQHTIKDYGKHIANVSISHVQNMKYICISVENRRYDQNTDKNDQLSNLRPRLAHTVERLFFLIEHVKQYFRKSHEVSVF